MPNTTHRTLLLMVLIAPFLAGCGLANKTPLAANGPGTPVQAPSGERQGTIPAGIDRQAPPDSPAGSPRTAVERFAAGYINWTYTSLPVVQARLAASATGQARAQELQARAQTQTDRALARAHIYNTGTVLAVVPLRGGQPGEWLVDTLERTGGGDQEYAASKATFHVALASVQRVTGGFAVSSWRPQV